MPQLTGCDNCILGSGTEAKTLLEADIENSVGIVAGTDNDINNLSIVMTAYELNPKLFVVIRKNRRHNDALFKQFNANITMQPTEIIAHECLAHMIAPLLAQFLTLVRNQSNTWANQLISELVSVVGETVPERWAVTVNSENTPAITELLSKGISVSLYNLTQDPADRNNRLDLVPLLLSRENIPMLVPPASTALHIGDRILFCGKPDARSALAILLNNTKSLTYIVDGIEIPDSIVWRWLKNSLKK